MYLFYSFPVIWSDSNDNFLLYTLQFGCFSILFLFVVRELLAALVIGALKTWRNGDPRIQLFASRFFGGGAVRDSLSG